MFSHTQFGLSFIILTFDDKANDYFARQQVLERLQGVDLPPGVQPQLAPLSTPIGEIYRYRLHGERHEPDRAAHRSRTGWSSRNLRLTPGVADVVSFGGFIKQYEVNLNLAQHEVATTSRCSRSSPRSAAATPTPAAATSSRASSST